MNIDPDALGRLDEPGEEDDLYDGLPWNHCARFDGIPGMVWYAKTRKVRGDQLQIGDWLDTLDHHGARAICGIWIGDFPVDGLTPERYARVNFDSPIRTVMFSATDTEIVRTDVEYDVVDPDSQVTPDGTPVVTYDAQSDA